MQCCEPGCEEEATYVAPKDWCDEHWLAWWTEGLPPEQVAEDRKFFKELNRDNP